jgi:sensor c-di-GMP phosphodiesterase-like protein
LSAALSERVFDLLRRDIEAGADELGTVYINVNLSAEEMGTAATLSLIKDFISNAGGRLRHLVIEVTERGALGSATALETITRMRELGVGIAIDDFGTGHSNLDYLARFEADFLKIDQLSVRALGTGAPTAAVVAHVVELARDLGVATIAERIETSEHAETLRQLGADKGRGWRFGRLMTMEALRGRLREEQRLPVAV